MFSPAQEIAPVVHTYRGGATEPERWASWKPRGGDIIVCTPPKSGTTWTQTILTMLVHGGVDLPDKVSVLSPWIDADLGVPVEEVAAALDAQPGRRVIKTHTPSDGFPIWDGVTVIAVYRHPLDVFFSLRKHYANVAKPTPDYLPFFAPVPESFRQFIDGTVDRNDFGRDTLASIALHYQQTACLGRVPQTNMFHYTDMSNDGHEAVRRLAKVIGIDNPSLVDKVAEATTFSEMKANAGNFTPVAGTGYWRSDAGFFDSASSQKWQGQLSDAEVGLFEQRLAELVPDKQVRTWLKNGGAASA